MTIPSAMDIEEAVDMQLHEDPQRILRKQKELYVAVGEKSAQFISGYLLGIKTVEVLLLMRGEEL